MLIFENEISQAMQYELYHADKVGSTPLPMDVLAQKVQASLPDSVSVTGISVSSDPECTYKVNLSKPRRAAIFIDQYTGQIKGKAERPAFFMTMFKLHRWLLDSMKPGDNGIFWGKMIVGTSTLMFVVVLVSGIVIWWPRTLKALKKGLTLPVGKGWHKFWHGLHVAGGMYALILVLVMALTGLTWSFSWYRTGFYALFGVEMAKSNGQKMASTDKGGPNRHKNLQKDKDKDKDAKLNIYANWQKVFDHLQKENPEYSLITVSDGKASVSIDHLGNQRAADTYRFDSATGRITDIQLYKDAETASKLRGWILSVHVGNWGGLTTRILWFLAALLGASLPLTGYYLWIRRLLRKNKH